MDGITFGERTYSQFELCWLCFQTTVSRGVCQRNPPAAGPTQRLFFAVTGAVLHQEALAKRQAVARARPVGAVESFPVHRILACLSLFRSNEDTGWLF